MAQSLKPELRVGIMRAALELCCEIGFERTAIAAIADRAGTSTANLYNYFADKKSIFAEALPPELLTAHDRLVEASIDELLDPAPDTPRASELLEFWIEQRLEMATVLGRDEGTPRAGYGQAFVAQLARRFIAAEPSFSQPHLAPLVHVVFDNTRSAIARILTTSNDGDEIRHLIDGFWSYQIPGLAGLARWATVHDHDIARPERNR